MALNLGAADESELKPKITVFGVGGAGGNAVNNMINKGLEGVDFVVANTDAQAIQISKADRRIQLGGEITAGLGAGMRPDTGRDAAEETLDQIIDQLSGANMCFITAGMGGGTGTGAAPVIAKAARELGVLTVGVVTKPFTFEGAKRMRLADEGIDQLQQHVDTLIIIPNQNLFRIATEDTTIMEAFNLADDVLYQGVKGVTDLMIMPGLINLDFADVRTVMGEMGKAMMGTGEADGDTRATKAAEKAIANPLLDEVSLQGARGVLINITGGYDLKLMEVDEAASRIKQEVDPDANIIVGSCFDESLNGTMRVSVVATGIEATSAAAVGSDGQRTRARRAYPTPRGVGEAEVGAGRRHAIHRAVNSADELEPEVEAQTEVAAEIYEEETRLVAGGGGGSFPVTASTAMVSTETMSAAAVAATPEPAVRGGLNLIRRVADSLTRSVGTAPASESGEPDQPQRVFTGGSLDEGGQKDDDELEIPAFLRRQAN